MDEQLGSFRDIKKLSFFFKRRTKKNERFKKIIFENKRKNKTIEKKTNKMGRSRPMTERNENISQIIKLT